MNNIAIVVSVPKSYLRPHSFWDGNKDEFFMRYANGIMYMDIDDLRKEFLYTNGLQDKIRQFRRERTSLILENECVGDMGNGAKIVFHIIPEWSFELGNAIDLSWFDKNTSVRPLLGSGWNYRYNADGYCIYVNEYATGALQTYTQFFHSGIIEATERISGNKPKVISDWRQMYNRLMEMLREYGDILDKIGVPKPWHISGMILNAKGCVSEGWGDVSQPIERNIVNSLNGVCNDEILLKDALEPVFSSLSNAFGYIG